MIRYIKCWRGAKTFSGLKFFELGTFCGLEITFVAFFQGERFFSLVRHFETWSVRPLTTKVMVLSPLRQKPKDISEFTPNSFKNTQKLSKYKLFLVIVYSLKIHEQRFSQLKVEHLGLDCALSACF